MFSHVMLGTNDIDEAKLFYDALFAALGAAPGVIDHKGRLMYKHEDNFFLLTLPLDGQPASYANGGPIGFSFASSELVDAWYSAGLANGGQGIEEPPGIRANKELGDVYLAYLRDPTGNKLCALHQINKKTSITC